MLPTFVAGVAKRSSGNAVLPPLAFDRGRDEQQARESKVIGKLARLHLNAPPKTEKSNAVTEVRYVAIFPMVCMTRGT
jgi:hypothetical protein